MNAIAARARPRPADLALVALLAAPMLMDAWWSEPGTRQADAVTYALVIGSLAALLVRRAAPVLVALFCGVALTSLTLLGHTGELLVLPSLIALYEVAAQGDRRRTTMAAVIASAWMGALGWFGTQPYGAPGGVPMLELLLPLVPLALGDAARSRRELVTATEAVHEARTTSRIAEERARMAREVHDVVGHTLAGVTIQLAAAESAFDVDRDVARTALTRARSSATEAMAELRSTVAGMRSDPGTTPQPGLARIDELLAPVRRAGVDVILEDRLPQGATVPAGPALTAYRVVQEALTNVVRHADARHVWIQLDAVDDQLRVSVRDDGRGRASTQQATPGRGFGLVGMAERVHAANGQLSVDTRPGGGFVVEAVLPLDGRPRAAVS